MRYAFYISGKSTRLRKYLEDPELKQDETIVVISDRILDKSVKELLRRKKILMYEYTDNIEINFSDYILDILSENRIDYCFSFGSTLLNGELLKKYENRIINFHPSILPMFPGLKSIDKAYNYEKEVFLIGNTAHFIDEGVDTGKIIMQSVIPIRSFGESKDYDIVLDLQIEMLCNLIEIIDENRLIVKDEDVYIVGANYCKGHIFPDI